MIVAIGGTAVAIDMIGEIETTGAATGAGTTGVIVSSVIVIGVIVIGGAIIVIASPAAAGRKCAGTAGGENDTAFRSAAKQPVIRGEALTLGQVLGKG
jgi:hypothetical protein